MLVFDVIWNLQLTQNHAAADEQSQTYRDIDQLLLLLREVAYVTEITII